MEIPATWTVPCSVFLIQSHWLNTFWINILRLKSTKKIYLGPKEDLPKTMLSLSEQCGVKNKLFIIHNILKTPLAKLFQFLVDTTSMILSSFSHFWSMVCIKTWIVFKKNHMLRWLKAYQNLKHNWQKKVGQLICKETNP